MNLSRLFFRLFLLCVGAIAFVLVLQGPVSHWNTDFLPSQPIDLGPILSKEALTQEDYRTLFLQTGLSQPAVDELLSSGPQSASQILSFQRSFFSRPLIECEPIFGPLVKEDRLLPIEGGEKPQFIDLHLGDILLTYSTHTLGWRHGHAGLVVDPSAGGKTLEAVLIGTDSSVVNAQHWLEYSNFMVLRLRDMTPELADTLVSYALNHLNGVPYRLSAGLGRRLTPLDPGFGVQCAYLVWYAFEQFGYDLDSDGGKLVTVDDIARSPLLEVVQIYGLDPEGWIDR